ncbi:MAG: transferrin receptor-like dimerization domain-containing protein [Sinobacteraceae bacterium]|nr:transferrin receptor-like dimerization domain-containing protein [Nevskiaceae bacterium]
MRDIIALLCAGLLAAVAAAAADDPAPSMLGFDARAAAAQAKLESRFDAQLNPGELRDWLRRLSAEPNQVGSPHDKENAEWLLAKFREWGWDAHLETFYALYPTPKSETLELVAPTAYRAALHEPALPEDRSSGAAGQLPPYNVYGGDGDVTAELVYVNYGMPDDYQELERLGISVKGRIVLARYGGGWRGLKPDLAEQHGAVGCIIYSDPRDDGYWQGDVWPQGGWRPPFGVQRGSVERMQEYPGDPLTPGVPATQDAQRLPLDRARVLLHIPVLPISAQDAQPLLAALGGPVAPEAWRGALPLTYHVGAGPAKVHLAVSSDWTLKPVYDVIARIAGRSHPDQWVIRGNHHDAWVFGAWDPLAGTVALMAEAKAIGKLVKSGWRPARTLIYASWDAEEPGLIGSTEWVEAHAPELAEHAVLYVNSDTNARGFLQAGGSHALQVLVNQVAAGVRDPETGVPVRERLRAKLEVDGFDAHADAEKKELARRAQAGGDLPIAALGSGSDYSAFLQHQGIATLSLEYGGEDADAGIYHSAYDSFDHYVRFGDPQFAYGIALAQTVGHTVLRMADAPVLPLQFGGFAETVADYVRQLHQLADDKRSRTETLRQLLETRAFTLAADPLNPLRPPAQEDEVPYLDFAPLDNAVVRLKRSAQAYDAVAANALALSEARRAALDRLLAGQEHRLMDARGLPGRPWFQHMIYAPGLYTGYGVKTLPGVREAIEQRQWDVAQRYAVIVAQRLDDYRAGLDQAVAILKGQD